MRQLPYHGQCWSARLGVVRNYSRRRVGGASCSTFRPSVESASEKGPRSELSAFGRSSLRDFLEMHDGRILRSIQFGGPNCACQPSTGSRAVVPRRQGLLEDSRSGSRRSDSLCARRKRRLRPNRCAGALVGYKSRWRPQVTDITRTPTYLFSCDDPETKVGNHQQSRTRLFVLSLHRLRCSFRVRGSTPMRILRDRHQRRNRRLGFGRRVSTRHDSGFGSRRPDGSPDSSKGGSRTIGSRPVPERTRTPHGVVQNGDRRRHVTPQGKGSHSEIGRTTWTDQ